MSYRVAAIDVHKKMLAVVVADVAAEGEYQFERRKFGGTPEQLQVLAQWLVQLEAEEVVMESTAQYWKPVWARWSSFGNQRGNSGKAPARCPARCTCAKPSPTAGRGVARATFGRRTAGQTAGGAGVGFEFRARPGAAAVAHGDTTQVSIDA